MLGSDRDIILVADKSLAEEFCKTGMKTSEAVISGENK